MLHHENYRFLIKTLTHYGFGDMLMAYRFTCILNDNGIPALYDCPNKLKELLPEEYRYHGEPCRDFLFEYHDTSKSKPTDHPIFDGRNMIQVAIDNFQRQFKITTPIEITLDYVPVVYRDVKHIPSVDVAMTTVGYTTPYKRWMHFKTLKNLLINHKISYIDLNEKNIMNMECLNYVAKAKVYLGLDTGTAHYVSMVAKQALILQSGYSSFNYWCGYDRYEPIHLLDIPCRNCFLTKDCHNNHACMNEISPEYVLTRIQEKL